MNKAKRVDSLSYILHTNSILPTALSGRNHCYKSAEWKFNETKDEMIFPEILNYPSLDLWRVDDDSARTRIAVLRKQELESSNFASDNRERG